MNVHESCVCVLGLFGECEILAANASRKNTLYLFASTHYKLVLIVLIVDRSNISIYRYHGQYVMYLFDSQLD